MSDYVLEASSLDAKEILVYNISMFNSNERQNKFQARLSQELWVHLCVQYAIAALHFFLVIPSNIFTLFVILRTKSLWNYSNAILGINAFFLATGSFLMLFVRQSHFPYVLYGRQERVIAYATLWWVCSLTFRIGNNRYVKKYSISWLFQG